MATLTIVVSRIVIITPRITTAERRMRAGVKVFAGAGAASVPYAVSLMPYTVSQERYAVRHGRLGTMPNRATELVWDEKSASPEGGLNRAAIVRAAIAIADAEGLDAVSIRHVAAALDVRPMSLTRTWRPRATCST